MPNWKKVITSGSDASLNALTLTGALSTSAGVQLTGLSTQNSEAKSLMITTGGVVGYRTLGDNAFNSTSFLTSLSGAVLTSTDQTIAGLKTFTGGITSNANTSLNGLSLIVSEQSSETDVLTINGSNIVGTRQLGSNAFTSTTIPTNNNELDNGAGYITSAFPFTGSAVISGSFVPHGIGPTSNTVIGESAGASLGSGATENIMIGKEAGEAQASGDSNIMIGIKAGEASTNDSRCILIGRKAGGASTLGNDNIFIGYEAGRDAASTHGSIGIGYQALFESNTGGGSGYNTAIGYKSGYSVTSGNFNVLLGYEAGYNLTTGASNIIIGSGSLAETGTTNQLRIGHADKILISGSLSSGDVAFPNLSADSSETSSLMINDDGVVKTRGLGSNAFNSTTIPTNNNQLTNGAGYTTNTGDIEGVTASTGLEGGGTSGTVSLNVNAAQTGITSIYNTSLIIGGASDSNHIGFSAGKINFTLGNQAQFNLTDGAIRPTTDNDLDLGTSTKRFKNIYGYDLTLVGLSADEGTTALMLNTETNAVGTRTLGSNAFNSTAFTTNTGTVTGTGTDNFLPKWNSAGTGIENSEISDTGALVKIGNDASNQETLYINTTDRKVGFRTQSPGSAFDVNGTMRVRNQLNVGHTSEQNLYVNGNGAAGGHYVKMGNYVASGSTWPQNGNYFGLTERENQPKYSAAFGNAGKVLQYIRVVTIKLSGNAFKNLSSTGTTLIPAPGSDYFIVPHFLTVHCDGGTKGSWNSNATAAIGFCAGTSTCTYPSQFNRVFRIMPSMLQLNNTSWIYNQSANNTGVTTGTNRALLLKSNQNITTAPGGNWYLQIHYQLINKTAGLINNVDKALTANS